MWEIPSIFLSCWHVTHVWPSSVPVAHWHWCSYRPLAATYVYRHCNKSHRGRVIHVVIYISFLLIRFTSPTSYKPGFVSVGSPSESAKTFERSIHSHTSFRANGRSRFYWSHPSWSLATITHHWLPSCPMNTFAKFQWPVFVASCSLF